jgi:hypothetical protein
MTNAAGSDAQRPINPVLAIAAALCIKTGPAERKKNIFSHQFRNKTPKKAV